MSELGMATSIRLLDFRSIIPFFLVVDTKVEYGIIPGSWIHRRFRRIGYGTIASPNCNVVKSTSEVVRFILRALHVQLLSTVHQIVPKRVDEV